MQTRVIFPPSRGGGWGRRKRPKLQRWSLDRQDGPFLEGKKDQMWEHWAREILSALGKESFFPVWQVIELCQFPRNQLVCGVLLCLTLWDPVGCSPPGSSVQRILQGRILEWVAISSSKGSSWPRDWNCVSFVSCIGRWVIYLLSPRGSPVSQLDLVLFFNQAALAGSPRGVAQSRTAPQANQCPLLCFPDLACSVPSAWNAYPHVCLCSLFRVYFRNHPLTPPWAPLIILSFCSCSFLDARTSFLGWHCLLSHWAHLDWASRGWRGSMVHLPPLVTGILQVRLFQEVRKQLEVSGQPQCTVLPAGGVSGSQESRCFWRLGLGEWEGKCLRAHVCCWALGQRWP